MKKSDWDHRPGAVDAATVTISDGTVTYGSTEFSGLRGAAGDFALDYDFNLEPDDERAEVWVVCRAIHQASGKHVTFAFNAAGDLEYPTERQYRSY